MTNIRPVNSKNLPFGAFLRLEQPQSNDGRGQHECMCRATMSPWDTGACIQLQRKSSDSLASFLSGFDDVPGLGPLDSDTSLNDSTSTMDGVSSLLSNSSSASWLRRKRHKQLRWGKVEMRFYPVMPGDHPDTIHGPPVSCSVRIVDI